jgi:hypothetical protein
LLVLLLLSCPDKGGIAIVLLMSWLTCTLMLCYTSGALLLTSGCTVTPASTGRHCSLPGRYILACILAADIFVSLAGTFLNYRLLSGNCRIIHLDLLVPASRSHTSGTPSTGMRGRSLAP